VNAYHVVGGEMDTSFVPPSASMNPNATAARASDEPEDGSYVAVLTCDDVWPYRRNDDLAARLTPARRWILQTPGEVADFAPDWSMSWPELCTVGPVAYVGAFVDRSGKEVL
jgi:hypothetical protein